MNEAEVHALLEEHDAIQSGHFKLSSGNHSDTFVQTALVLCFPGIAERLGHSLGAKMADVEATVVIGPALAGIVIGHEVARYLEVPMMFSERVEQKMELRRGFTLGPHDRVLIVENVVTTGGSQREVIDLVGSTSAEVVGVGALVDRSSGVSFGVPYRWLLGVQPEQWEPDDCPLCSRGEALTSPGSRHLR